MIKGYGFEKDESYNRGIKYLDLAVGEFEDSHHILGITLSTVLASIVRDIFENDHLVLKARVKRDDV